VCELEALKKRVRILIQYVNAATFIGIMAAAFLPIPVAFHFPDTSLAATEGSVTGKIISQTLLRILSHCSSIVVRR
jgi:hypothetical protein